MMDGMRNNAKLSQSHLLAWGVFSPAAHMSQNRFLRLKADTCGTLYSLSLERNIDIFIGSLS